MDTKISALTIGIPDLTKTNLLLAGQSAKDGE